LHCREEDGTGSKHLSKFNELIAGVRARVPDMIIQVGGSISFSPESDEEGAEAKWLSDEARHMLAELKPAPDQVTIAINTTQMNIMDLMSAAEYSETSLANPALYHAYREMVVPAGPQWVEEHLRRLTAAGIQPHFQLTCMPDLETLERLVRRGHYKGPLNLTWVGIGGGFDGPNPNNFMEFIRRAPDGSTITLETLMRHVLPVSMSAAASRTRSTTSTARSSRRCSRSSRSFGLPPSLAARSPMAAKRAKSTRSACNIIRSRRRWPSWAWYRTVCPAGARCRTVTRRKAI
jgi:uncharacterized protein (DUF849 family)